MRNRIITAIVAGVCLLFAGCSGLNNALRISQSISGNYSVTTSNPLGTATVVVENARQEDGQFKADKIDAIATTTLIGKIEIHGTEYSRPIIKPKGAE